MNIGEFQAKLFAAGQQAGFADMELYYEKTEKFECQLYKGEVDSYVTSDIWGVTFRGLYKEKMGYSFTESLDDESLTFLVQEAKKNAEVNEDDVQETIFSGSERYQAHDFYAKHLDEISIPDKMNFLKKIDESLYRLDDRVIGTDSLSLESASTERGIINNKGLSLHERNNGLCVFVSVIAQKDAQIKSGFKMKYTKIQDTLNPEDFAREAVEEAVSQLNPKHTDSKKYPILLRSDAAASLMHVYAAIFSAENTQAGNSLLKDKLGETIAVPFLQVVDDPFRPDGLFSRTFDSEGVATQKRSIVNGGKLMTLLHNRKTAVKDKTETTGHAFKSSYKAAVTVSPTNMYIVPSEMSRDDMIASVQEGIMITDLSGLHSGANTTSGDFSLAAKGFYIKNGTKEHPINQMTIAGNFYVLLQTVEKIGSDLEFSAYGQGGYVGSPSLLIKQLAVTVD